VLPRYRSGLEKAVAAQLKTARVSFKYEALVVPYVLECDYNPDFLLPNGIIVETKGHFESSDRRKLLTVKRQHPDLDLRLVFSNSRNRIAKKSNTTYAQWATSKGFPFADKLIPAAWLREPENRRSLSAINNLLMRK
jgi:hypothetical protein